jgi:hypothetical protein
VTLAFHPAARDEFVAAAEFYDAAVPGLGDRFLVAVERTTRFAREDPETGRSRASARSLPVWGFPYDVIYTHTR